MVDPGSLGVKWAEYAQSISGHHTHPLTCSLTRGDLHNYPIHLPTCFGKWEKTREPVDNPHRHRESMHRNSKPTSTQAQDCTSNSGLRGSRSTCATLGLINLFKCIARFTTIYFNVHQCGAAQKQQGYKTIRFSAASGMFMIICSQWEFHCMHQNGCHNIFCFWWKKMHLLQC